jgi:hypothetical protein
MYICTHMVLSLKLSSQGADLRSGLRGGTNGFSLVTYSVERVFFVWGYNSNRVIICDVIHGQRPRHHKTGFVLDDHVCKLLSV